LRAKEATAVFEAHSFSAQRARDVDRRGATAAACEALDGIAALVSLPIGEISSAVGEKSHSSGAFARPPFRDRHD